MTSRARTAATVTGILVGALVLAQGAPALAHWRRVPHRHWRHTVVVSPARPVRHVVLVAGRPAAVVDFNVTPKATRIFVDRTYRGTCAEYDGFPNKMALKPGRHHLRLVTPDGREYERRVELAAGYEVNVNLDLR